jgi:hypothetical protein
MEPLPRSKDQMLPRFMFCQLAGFRLLWEVRFTFGAAEITPADSAVAAREPEENFGFLRWLLSVPPKLVSTS